MASSYGHWDVVRAFSGTAAKLKRAIHSAVIVVREEAAVSTLMCQVVLFHRMLGGNELTRSQLEMYCCIFVSGCNLQLLPVTPHCHFN